MTIAITPVTNNQTFGTWLQRTNDLIAVVSNSMITADTSTDGSITTGTGYVNGAFGSNTLFATTLAGGLISSPSLLTISTQTEIANTLLVDGGATFANMVQITWADGTVTNSIYTTIGSNTQIAFNDSGVANTSSYLTFNKSTRTLNVGNVINAAFITGFAGSQTAPTFTFSGNTDTGIFSSTASTVDITAGGVKKITANSTAVVINDVSISSVNINNTAQLYSNTYTFATSSASPIDSFPLTSYRSAEYLIEVANSSSAYQVSKIIVYHNGTNSFDTEYAMLASSGQILTYSVDINSGNLRVIGTPVNSGDTSVTVKFVRTALVL